MPIDYRVFIHPSDKVALEALKKIPGFTTIAKKYMEFRWERLLKTVYMSSYLRLGPNQLPEIYNLLPPICKKLGIPEPALYLELNREVNAFTNGDTQTTIILTTGLLEAMTPEEIQIIMAHECGHILCRHVLFHKMGSDILDGSSVILNSLGILKYLTIPLQYAFYYWIRCSEYSADRVATYFAGSADLVTSCMFKLAGANHNFPYTFNKDVYIQQARDYKNHVEDSALNKAYEIAIVKDIDHPFTALRALEAMEWASTKEYQDLISGSIQALPEKYEKKKTFITPALNKNVVNVLNIDMITKWFDEREYLAGTNLTIIDLATCKETLDPMVERERKKNSKMIYLLIDNEDKTILGHGVFTYQRLDPELEAALRRYNGKIVYMKEG